VAVARRTDPLLVTCLLLVLVFCLCSGPGPEGLQALPLLHNLLPEVQQPGCPPAEPAINCSDYAQTCAGTDPGPCGQSTQAAGQGARSNSTSAKQAGRAQGQGGCCRSTGGARHGSGSRRYIQNGAGCPHFGLRSTEGPSGCGVVAGQAKRVPQVTCWSHDVITSQTCFFVHMGGLHNVAGLELQPQPFLKV